MVIQRRTLRKLAVILPEVESHVEEQFICYRILQSCHTVMSAEVEAHLFHFGRREAVDDPIHGIVL
jgi:hypothetical protein